jgi:LuxR family quorum-sensing system transcriptional regulator SolR
MRSARPGACQPGCRTVILIWRAFVGIHAVNDDIVWREAKTEALNRATTEEALFAVVTQAATELGFEYCAYGLRMPLPVSNPRMLLLNNYSDEWRKRYVGENYLAIDPTVAHGIKSVVPVLWSDALFESCSTFWEDARGHGLKVGWAQSAYDARSAVGMLTMARSHDEITAAELREKSVNLSWLTHAVHETAVRVVGAQRPGESAILLTSREVEVLRWTADGKTSGEVGQIMDISERTVNFHITNALVKLGVNNKTAGVVKAVMLRLL